MEDPKNAGADYETLPDRLPTVKLTDAEKTNLITAILRILDAGEIKWLDAEEALASVFGVERAADIIGKLKGMEAGERWTRRENAAVIGAFYPLIPGDTEEAKSDWLIERAAPCFDPERFQTVILPYVLERVAEFKAAGGTLTAYPARRLPRWDECTLASCWRDNAAKRHMNALSPHMPDSVFDEYLEWQAAQGCNVVPLGLANLADGQFGGFCLYGGAWSWSVDKTVAALFRNRIAKIRTRGLGVMPFLFMDDSGAYTSAARRNFPKYLADLRQEGILDQASLLCVGLELQDYYDDRGTVAELVAAARTFFPGKIATHEIPGKHDFADLGDVCLYQTKIGLTPAQVEAEIRRVCAAVGRPVFAFELSRDPDRALCLAALRGGAYGAGNWQGGPLEAAGQPPDAGDIPEGTIFLHHDVSAWPVTSALSAFLSSDNDVWLDYDKAKVWPANGDGLNANSWVIVNRNGQWYAATWEWLRLGQTSKDMGGKSWGGHIKAAPLPDWEPTSGERIGLMVSGLARTSERNVKERTNVCWMVVP